MKGETIKQRLSQVGMTQVELARLLKVSPQSSPDTQAYDLEERVRTLLKERQRKMSDLCRYVGMTEAGARRMFARHSCTTTTLMKIADFLDLPVSALLPHDPHTTEEEAKTRQIQFLRGQIDVYRNAISTLLHNGG